MANRWISQPVLWAATRPQILSWRIKKALDDQHGGIFAEFVVLLAFSVGVVVVVGGLLRIFMPDALEALRQMFRQGTENSFSVGCTSVPC